jgi:hypothetical protein
MIRLSQNEVTTCSRYSMKDLQNALRAHIHILFVLFLNFITHFIFLPLYTFYSDDWSILAIPFLDQYSYSSLLLESQRPFFWIGYKLQYALFGDNPLGHHLLGLLTTSIVLILVYEISKKIFRDVGQSAEYYPFLTAVIFCVLFNKDEVYPWAILSSGIPYMAYLGSFYFYLHRDRKYFLTFSLIAYTLGLFSYEIGIALPLLFVCYDYFIKSKERTGLLFLIPLLFYLGVRLTNWFGLGFAFVNRGIGNWEIGALLSNTSHHVLYSFVVFSRQVNLALLGLATLAWWQLLGLISIICILVFLLGNLLKREDKSDHIQPIIFAISGMMIVTFFVPFILQGAMATRHFILVDFGIALLIVGLLSYGGNSWRIHWLMIITVGICILLNQGLYANWVTSGNIQEDVSHYIQQHSEEIGNKKWVYFDVQSFITEKPNRVENPFTGLIKSWLFSDTRPPRPATEMGVGTTGQGGTGLALVYSPYYNSPCLDRWALEGMLQKYLPTFRSDHLIYGNDGNVPERVTDDRIIFRDMYAGGAQRVVWKSDCSIISYASIYGDTDRSIASQ